MSKVTSITMLEHIADATDVLRIVFDEEQEAIIFGDGNEIMTYLDKDVIVTFRRDMYKGQMVQTVNNLTLAIKVNVLPKTTEAKLYTEYEDTTCNVCFQDVPLGSHMEDVILLCQSYEYESSDRATWVKMVCTDRVGRTAVLRLFDYKEDDKNFAGMYIQTNIKRTKFGFNASGYVKPLDQIPNLNPEIDLCERYIMNVFVNDTEMLEFIAKSRIFDYMREYVDKERGYLICRTAYEMSYIASTCDLYPGLNSSLLMRSALASKVFCLATESRLSNATTNIVVLSRYKLSNARDINVILDSDPKNISQERIVYKQIESFVDGVINAKKDV